MKTILLTLILTALVDLASAQSYITRTGTVRFFSETTVEDIEAVNKQVSSVLDISKNEFAFLVPIKAFIFEKALMQEHFNENYLESDQYPNASFKGSIEPVSDIDVTSDGEYPVVMSGTMNIHGTNQQINENAVIKVNKGNLSLTSDFKLRPEDYGINIPAGKRANISEILEITVLMDYAKK